MKLASGFCTSRRCMRSWRKVLDGPFHGQKPLVRLVRPHYPQWRGCQGVHGHSPGGERDHGAPVPTKRHHLEETVCVSRPKPISWQPLSRPNLIVLRARQPLPCTPWLSCRFTKPRHSNRCTSVVPTRGWCRSCAWRLISLYEQRKSQRGPLRKAMDHGGGPGVVVQEHHLWLNLAEMNDVDKACFLDAPISKAGLFGDTVEGFAQQFSAVQQQTEASSTSCPGVTHWPLLPPGPGLSLPVAVGIPPASSRAAPPQAESTPRPAHRASRRRAAPPPCPSQAPSCPGSRWSGPVAGNPEMLDFALSQKTARTAPFLPPEEGREENPMFLCSVPTFSKKEQFPFPPGSTLLPHSRPRPILPVANSVQFGDAVPPHAPLASPVWDQGSSARMP